MPAPELTSGATITLRGEGGSVFDQDVPPEGSVQRELLDYMLSTGKVVVIDTPKPEPKRPRRPAATAPAQADAEEAQDA